MAQSNAGCSGSACGWLSFQSPAELAVTEFRTNADGSTTYIYNDGTELTFAPGTSPVGETGERFEQDVLNAIREGEYLNIEEYSGGQEIRVHFDPNAVGTDSEIRVEGLPLESVRRSWLVMFLFVAIAGYFLLKKG